MKAPISVMQNPFSFLRPITPLDYNFVGNHFKMREIDEREAQAITGVNPYIALRQSMLCSKHVWAVQPAGGVTIGYLGVVEMEQDGIPWFVASDELDKHKKLLLKWSPRILAVLNAGYPTLINFVSVENKKTINWLKWLGFTIDTEEIIFTDPNVPFYRFTKESKIPAKG